MTKTAKWLGFGLIASLALNLFVIGAWAGKITRHHDRLETERVTLGPITDALSTDGQHLMRDSMKANRKEAIPIFKQLLNARERAIQALDAEPYNADDYAAALRDIRTYSEAGQTLLHATLVDVVGKLSQEDRHRLAQEIRRQQNVTHRGRGEDGPPLHKAPPPPPLN
jgi:uncharacterized membrane protein